MYIYIYIYNIYISNYHAGGRCIEDPKGATSMPRGLPEKDFGRQDHVRIPKNPKFVFEQVIAGVYLLNVDQFWNRTDVGSCRIQSSWKSSSKLWQITR